MSNSTVKESALYIIATPIGNIEDITFRAVNTLKQVDIIACEDTRVTAKLLQAYNITTKTTVYNDFSTDKERRKILNILLEGKSVALVSDAGTPLISDPGYKLVKEIHEAGIKVISLPGASSVLTSLTLSTIPSNRFLFNGFMPPKQSGRVKVLNELKEINSTLIFFETARRLADVLPDMLAVLGNRDIAVLRELTKKYEEVKIFPLKEAVDFYSNNPTKGEIVLVVSPPVFEEISTDKLEHLISEQLERGENINDLAKELALKTGMKKKDIYNLALKLREAM